MPPFSRLPPPADARIAQPSFTLLRRLRHAGFARSIAIRFPSLISSGPSVKAPRCHSLHADTAQPPLFRTVRHCRQFFTFVYNVIDARHMNDAILCRFIFFQSYLLHARYAVHQTPTTPRGCRCHARRHACFCHFIILPPKHYCRRPDSASVCFMPMSHQWFRRCHTDIRHFSRYFATVTLIIAASVLRAL